LIFDSVKAKGQIKTHKAHNHEIHALVGNTTPAGAKPGPPPGLPPPAILPPPKRTITKFALAERILDDDRRVPVHPGPKIAIEQWKVHGKVWASWWRSAGVSGTGEDPFVYFPETFVFGGRVFTPNYTKKTWQLILPVLMYIPVVGEDAVVFNGQPDVDIATKQFSWLWPSGKEVAEAILNGISDTGQVLGPKAVADIRASTPSFNQDIKDAYRTMRLEINKILNPITARRDPRFNEVKARYGQLMVAKQAEITRVKVEYDRLKDELNEIQEARDTELRGLDPNMTSGKVTVEDQLARLGASDAPLAAPSAQRSAQPLPARDLRLPGEDDTYDFMAE
jgi:hypothetical protein